ncbi:hypothetical protein L228DRAFT_285573 [Xylona heveae TC161]|uniref:SGF29 C-terminal domain-containing protein n=1 Tax=Xylona heveae (strain CBS 132557 / TC161) TaxID=1328760 RepID=A0A164ZWM5_XYLHT|nr:hypothetical protein L228DRAFT_285573 [Xylona heveae TC161]KZF19626.1 hypothetical protein L228DRAFT_285573 [Xylona heveae TC161]
MAARNRPRGLVKEDVADAHEERNMWNQIVTDMKKLKALHARAAEVSKLIVETEERLAEQGTPTVAEIDSLQHLYREGLKLAEEEQKILKEEPNDVVKNISILTALRSASETDPPRSSNPLKPRNPKRRLETDGAGDSPGPSSGTSSAGQRFKGSNGRSTSVPFGREGREVTVKLEDGAETPKNPFAEKYGQLVVGADVAYKQSKAKGVEGDWIQCNISAVLGEGNKRRYEVQDAAPEDNGAPAATYKTSAASLIVIPAQGTPLPEYPKGKQVLALYPDTTTFYRAEVMRTKNNTCVLKFEGEDEINKEMEVDRRFVLDVSK